jgi:hypothetical protein
MTHKNGRVELEMKILKSRAIARGVNDELSIKLIAAKLAELEQKLREIDEWAPLPDLES